MSISALIGPIFGIIDKLIPDPEQKQKAKLQLLEMEKSGDLAELNAAVSVITAEAKGGSFIQRSWRPMVMLWFAGLVGAHWFGFTPENLSEAQVADLLDIVKIGIGGYVVGRSAEKIMKEYKS